MYGTITFSSTRRNLLLYQVWHSYKVRLFRSKAALVPLLWVFTASLSISFAYSESFFGKYRAVYFGGAVALFAPIALLADIYLGRYKVIQYSMRLLWIAMIVSNTIIAVQNYVGYIQAVSYTLIVFIIVGEAGSAGILVNSLQFGIDQLTDASPSVLYQLVCLELHISN